MSIMDRVEELARAGKPREGIALMERSAAAADPEALFILANWRLWGLYGPKDLAATHSLLDQATDAGWPGAAVLRATLIGNGTGCLADPERARRLMEPLARDDPRAAEQLRLVARMTGGAPPTEILSADPDIRIARAFLTDGECAYLIGRAEPRLRPSTIIDPMTGRPRPHPVRTSSSMNFAPPDEDLVVHALNRRIALLTATDVATGEPLHVLRYTVGQEFRPHLDAIAGAKNQRQWTALIYLNDEFDGGETVFPEIGITTVGRPGDCLIFRVSDDDGKPDQRLRHAGLPVTGGTKWLASRWIRQRPYEAEVMPR